MALWHKPRAVTRQKLIGYLRTVAWKGRAGWWSSHSKELWVERWKQHQSGARRAGLVFPGAELGPGKFSQGGGPDIPQSLILSSLIVPLIRSSSPRRMRLLCPRYDARVGETKQKWKDPNPCLADSLAQVLCSRSTNFCDCTWPTPVLWFGCWAAGREKGATQSSRRQEWVSLCSWPWFPSRMPFAFKRYWKTWSKRPHTPQLHFLFSPVWLWNLHTHTHTSSFQWDFVREEAEPCVPSTSFELEENYWFCHVSWSHISWFTSCLQ